MSLSLHALVSAWVWLPILLLLFFTGAWWGYRRTVPTLTPRQRWGLTLLRGLSLVLIGCALFQMEATIGRHYRRQFHVGILLDGSESMTLTDRQGSRKQTVDALLSKLPNKLDAVLISDSILTSEHPSTLWNENRQPGHTSSAERMLAAASKFDGAILLTDAAFDEGAAFPIPDKPVWGVAIGDTLPLPNSFLAEPILPTKVVANREFAVRCLYGANGLSGASASISASISGGSVTTRPNLQFRADGAVDTIELRLRPSKAGWQTLTLDLAVPNDSIVSDNRRTFPVFVREAQVPVTIIYGAVHPDAAAIHRALGSDSGYSVTMMDEAAAVNKLPAHGSVLLLHAPHENTATGLTIARWAVQYPHGLLWMPGSAGYSAILAERFSSSGLQRRSSGEIINDTPIPTSERLLSFGSLPEPDWTRLPPVVSWRNLITAKANIAATVKGIEPAVVIQAQPKRSIAFFIWDVWRWQQTPLESGKGERTNGVWLTLTEWLSADVTKTFRVVPDVRYSIGSESRLEAVWLNPAGEPMTGGVVMVEDGERTIQLTEQSPGRYLGKYLPNREGKAVLRFRGTAKDGSSQIDSLNVEVDRYSHERINPVASPKRLTRLSSSGGGLLSSSQLPALVDSLQHVQVEQTDSMKLIIWQSIYSLILALILLCLEWWWRTRIGML